MSYVCNDCGESFPSCDEFDDHALECVPFLPMEGESFADYSARCDAFRKDQAEALRVAKEVLAEFKPDEGFKELLLGLVREDIHRARRDFSEDELSEEEHNSRLAALRVIEADHWGRRPE